MYSLSEMEAGEKSNRSSTAANPCLCCCPTIEMSTRVTAIIDIILHVILFFRTMGRLFFLNVEENILLACVAAMTILLIIINILILIGVTRLLSRSIFLVVVYLWWAVHLILMVTWFWVVYYTVRTFVFSRTPFRRYEVTNIIELSTFYAIFELFMIFLIYAWSFFVMVAFAHFVKTVTVYPEREASFTGLTEGDRLVTTESGEQFIVSANGERRPVKPVESNRPPC